MDLGVSSACFLQSYQVFRLRLLILSKNTCPPCPEGNFRPAGCMACLVRVAWSRLLCQSCTVLGRCYGEVAMNPAGQHYVCILFNLEQ